MAAVSNGILKMTVRFWLNGQTLLATSEHVVLQMEHVTASFSSRDKLEPLKSLGNPKTVVNSDSVTVFKSRLKTFLFSRAFCLPSSQ